MRSLLMSALLIFSCALAASAEPVSIEVVRMSPSSGFVLPRFGKIYIEVAYRADQPVRLQAQAFADGRSLDEGQMMNASAAHPSGSGRALVWVGYSEPAVIDEIRITAYDAKWQPLKTLPVARPAHWLAKSAERRTNPPDWAEALMDAENRIAEQYRIDNPPAPDPLGDALVTFMFLAIPGYLILQGIALVTQRGRWRWAALAPLLLMAPATLNAVFALSAGSNLWPVVLIITAPFGFVYLVLLFALRWLRGGGPSFA